MTLSMFATAGGGIGRDTTLVADGVVCEGGSATVTLPLFARTGACIGGDRALAGDGLVFAGGSVMVALLKSVVASVGIDADCSFVFGGEGIEEGVATILVLMFGWDDRERNADKTFVSKDCK